MSLLSFPPDKPYDVVGLGLNAVDHLCVVADFPESGSKTPMLEFTRQGGGQVATAMVALARLGLRVKYLGKVGDDDIGRFSLESLESQGIDVSDVRTITGEDSQFAFILVSRRTGERTILWKRGERLKFEDGDFPASCIQQGRLLHLDTHEVPGSITAALHARAAGIPVLLDAERIRDRTDELVRLCDVVLADDRFGREYTQESEPHRILRALSDRTGARIVGLTRGEAGSMAMVDGEVVEAAGFSVPVVNTAGAGDVYHAGFGYGLLHGWDLHRICRFANAVAALKCTRLGGRAGIPTLPEVEAFMRNREK